MSDEPPKTTTGEHPVTVISSTVKTLAACVAIASATLGGARWLVTSTWAQGKEHADAGVAIVRAELAAHIAEEATARRRTDAQLGELRVEMREFRQEMRAFYNYTRSGKEPAILDKPLPPLDGGQ